MRALLQTARARPRRTRDKGSWSIPGKKTDREDRPCGGGAASVESPAGVRFGRLSDAAGWRRAAVAAEIAVGHGSFLAAHEIDDRRARRLPEAGAQCRVLQAVDARQRFGFGVDEKAVLAVF